MPPILVVLTCLALIGGLAWGAGVSRRSLALIAVAPLVWLVARVALRMWDPSFHPVASTRGEALATALWLEMIIWAVPVLLGLALLIHDRHTLPATHRKA